MPSVTLTFSVQEIQLILKAIEVTDPHKMYAVALSERIVKESNEQLKPKEEPVAEEEPKSSKK